ncbi:DUF3784 domain-containing protein [Sutcliffiella halmapala]|uniref:DUF3784 domain-containing protein n=1 Tax=Sutcliffiella halmapala TaxID=79882 RepID=UPI000995470C|nr:DUF3784 domain-containing protein [Sutcliffiella halmapala]
MWLLFFIQLSVVLTFLILGWAILKKEAYGLISNFKSRPEAEQAELIQNGYPQRIGKLLIGTALGMLILFPLIFTPFTYALEVQFSFMLVFLLGGFIYLSKYEVINKRKRSYIISMVLFIVVIGFVAGLSVLGYQEFELVIQEDTFEVTGLYGDEWKYEEIRRVELFEVMPEVTYRTNGFGLPTMSKGHFKVKDFGNSLLYLYKGDAPYLYIELEDQQIFINSKSAIQTENWYNHLSQEIENTN